MKNINIVMIGDSNTEGYGLGHIKETCPFKLEQMLNRSGHCSTVVHNMGVSGSCVINARMDDGTVVGYPYVLHEKYQKALSINGSIYIINLGTNDAQDGMHDTLDVQNLQSNLIAYKSQFKSDYKSIIDTIRSLHPKAIVVMCSPIPVTDCIWRKHQQKYLDQLLPYFKEIAQEESLIHIDLFSIFRSLSPSEMNELYQPDGLHLNENGTTFVTNILYDTLCSMIQ